MKRFFPSALAALFALALVLSFATTAPRAADTKAAATQHWVCVACNLPCDTLVFDHPGTCPQCGMTLVTQAEAKAQAAVAAQGPQPRKVAILLFNSAEIIDFSGPYEVFGTAGYNVYTVAATKDPITTAMGMSIVPKYSFADAPQPDLLLVPGGGVKGACTSEPTLAWLRKTSAAAGHTLSVCNGAFILASAGLLDGLTATTTAHLIDQLHAKFPKVNVVRDQRFVDNGRIVTAGGLTSGIDAALHMVSVLDGRGQAQDVALSQEYDWRPDTPYLRAALADMHIPNIDMDKLGHWKLVRTEGDTGRWDVEAQGTSDLAPADLRAKVDEQFQADGKWTKSGATGWSMQDAAGQRWTGTLEIENDAARAHGYRMHLAITRAG